MIKPFISSFSRNNSDIFFIQIGSNDGSNGDPLSEFIKREGWAGILVEPVKYLFDKLVNNYQSSKNLIFENAAISSKNEVRDFYYLRQTNDQLPVWYSELGSFNLEVVLSHKSSIPNLENYLVSSKTNCMTFDDLLNKHRISKVDLIHIDAEGYDYEIIKTINFSRIKPGMLIFEHRHLQNNSYDECVKQLKSRGYRVYKLGGDSIALRDNSPKL